MMKLISLMVLFVLVSFSCSKNAEDDQENILETPKNLKVKSGSITSDAFTVEWSKVDQADSYELIVEYETSGSAITGSPFQEISNPVTGSKVEKAISGLSAETEYRFKVKSKKGDDFSKFTDYVSVKTLEQQTQYPNPKNLDVKTGSITSNGFTAQWDIDNADSYELVVKDKSSGSDITGSPFTVSKPSSGSKVEKAIIGLDDYTQYSFKVRGKYGDKYSAYSNDFIVVTLDGKYPKPKNLIIKLGSIRPHRFTVQWAIDNADSYELVVEKSGSSITGSPFTVSKPSVGLVEKEITGLTANTEYKFKVRGKYSSEYSNYTQEESVTTSIEKQDKPSGFILKKAPSSEGNYFEMEWDRDVNAELYELEVIDASTNLHIHNGVSKAPFKVTNPSSGNKVSKIVAQALTTTDNSYKCKLRIKYKDGSWSKYTDAVSVKTLKRHTGSFSVKTGTLIKNGLTLEWNRDTDAKSYELSIVDGSGSNVITPININNPSSGNVEKAITVTTAGAYTAKLRVKYNDDSWSLFSEYTLHKYMFSGPPANFKLKGKNSVPFILEWDRLDDALRYEISAIDNMGSVIKSYTKDNPGSGSKVEIQITDKPASLVKPSYYFKIRAIYPSSLLTEYSAKIAVNIFTILSSAFKDGDNSIAYTHYKHNSCNAGAKNEEIPLQWTNPPTGTEKFLIVMDDTYNNGDYWVHWIEVNIDKSKTKTDPNKEDGELLYNYWDIKQYDGPCPPAGSGLHTYRITIFALGKEIGPQYIIIFNSNNRQKLSDIKTYFGNPHSGFSILGEASISFTITK